MPDSAGLVGLRGAELDLDRSIGRVMALSQEDGTTLAMWRKIADWGKRRELVLRLADRLGRGKGRLRWMDSLSKPPAPQHRPDLADWENHDLAAVWIGHATILLRMGGKTILPDPVLGNRIGLGLGFITGGPLRLAAPALQIPELPPVDLVLVSHAHFDHLDRPTLRRLPKSTPVITARNTRDLLDDLGFTAVTELAWGEDLRLDDLLIRAWEVKHWGARTFLDDHRQACSFVLEASGKRVLFGGDTAFGEHFAGLGKVDLAILGIGAYDPWITGHANPEQAMVMADQMRADFILPMHHSTFCLSHEPMTQPLERMQQAAGRGVDRLVIHQIGQMWKIP